MQVDGSGLGIANQGGDSRFLDRFAFVPHGAWDPSAAMRTSLEHQNPLIAARVTGGTSAPLPAGTWSLIALPSPDVLLWALKPAEEGIGQGVIARVWNVADGARTMALSLPAYGIASARRTTHIETDLGSVTLAGGAVQQSLARQQLATFRLFPGAGGGPDVTPPASIRDFSSP